MAAFKKPAYLAPRYVEFSQTGVTLPINTYVFIADDYYDFVAGQIRYQQAGGSGATADFVKVPTGTALGSGVSCTNGAVALTQTADTTYSQTKNTTTPANVSLVPGDAIAIKFAGTLTGLQGFCAQCELKPTRISASVR